MSKVLTSSSVLAPTPPALAKGETRPGEVSLPRLLAGYRGILCAIAPDAAGRRIVQRVAAAIGGRDCRLGIVSAAPFELPVDASACLFPTPLDRRARLVVARQRALDALVKELGLPEAAVFASAGHPADEIRDIADLWHADIVLFARSAKTGLRTRHGRHGRFDAVALDDDGRIAGPSFLERLLGTD